MGEPGPQGHILIEVDDLATHGNAVHVENMAKLHLQVWQVEEHPQQEGDYAGRTVIQDQSYIFYVHLAKFVPERLSPVVISRGRRSDKKSETTDGEKRQLRAVWGSVNWVCQHWHHLSWDHSTVQDFCVTRTWQVSE